MSTILPATFLAIVPLQNWWHLTSGKRLKMHFKPPGKNQVWSRSQGEVSQAKTAPRDMNRAATAWRGRGEGRGGRTPSQPQYGISYNDISVHLRPSHTFVCIKQNNHIFHLAWRGEKWKWIQNSHSWVHCAWWVTYPVALKPLTSRQKEGEVQGYIAPQLFILWTPVKAGSKTRSRQSHPN